MTVTRPITLLALALVPLTAFARTAMHPATPPTPSSRSGRFHLPAPCSRAMPLFTAEGERLWAPGWDPEQISGSTERGSVFRTLRHDGRPVTWIVVAYDPSAGRASYARLVEGSNMGIVDVRCTDEGAGSDVEVTYTLTGLDAEGDDFVSSFLEPGHYADMLREWQRHLVAALGK